jgi:hypothetical protein
MRDSADGQCTVGTAQAEIAKYAGQAQMTAPGREVTSGTKPYHHMAYVLGTYSYG